MYIYIMGVFISYLIDQIMTIYRLNSGIERPAWRLSEIFMGNFSFSRPGLQNKATKPTS